MTYRIPAPEFGHFDDRALAELLARARAEQRRRSDEREHRTTKDQQRLTYGPEGKTPEMAAAQIHLALESGPTCLWCIDGRATGATCAADTVQCRASETGRSG